MRHRIGKAQQLGRIESGTYLLVGISKMSSRRQQRRADKAVKRKRLLAERRKTQAIVPSSVAAQAKHAAAAPIYRCLLQEELFERGSGTLVLARGTPRDGFVVGGFLLDTFCLGVTDIVFHAGLGEAEVAALIAAVDETAALEPVEPGYARKLLQDTVAYARSNGIEPYRDYAAAEALFGDTIADAGDAIFTFGYEGRPLYIPSLEETPATFRQRLKALRKKLGDDGFDLDLSQDDLPYDPDIAPDPVEWLAVDEEERLDWIRAYHQEADDDGTQDDQQAELEEKTEVHVGLHVAVENQLAADDPPATRRALQRLLDEGLDRHQAIHAIGFVLLDEMMNSAREQRDFSSAGYTAQLDALTFESWRSATAPEDEP